MDNYYLNFILIFDSMKLPNENLRQFTSICVKKSKIYFRLKIFHAKIFKNQAVDFYQKNAIFYVFTSKNRPT